MRIHCNAYTVISKLTFSCVYALHKPRPISKWSHPTSETSVCFKTYKKTHPRMSVFWEGSIRTFLGFFCSHPSTIMPSSEFWLFADFKIVTPQTRFHIRRKPSENHFRMSKFVWKKHSWESVFTLTPRLQTRERNCTYIYGTQKSFLHWTHVQRPRE